MSDGFMQFNSMFYKEDYCIFVILFYKSNSKIS